MFDLSSPDIGHLPYIRRMAEAWNRLNASVGVPDSILSPETPRESAVVRSDAEIDSRPHLDKKRDAGDSTASDAMTRNEDDMSDFRNVQDILTWLAEGNAPKLRSQPATGDILWQWPPDTSGIDAEAMGFRRGFGIAGGYIDPDNDGVLDKGVFRQYLNDNAALIDQHDVVMLDWERQWMENMRDATGNVLFFTVSQGIEAVNIAREMTGKPITMYGFPFVRYWLPSEESGSKSTAQANHDLHNLGFFDHLDFLSPNAAIVYPPELLSDKQRDRDQKRRLSGIEDFGDMQRNVDFGGNDIIPVFRPHYRVLGRTNVPSDYQRTHMRDWGAMVPVSSVAGWWTPKRWDTAHVGRFISDLHGIAGGDS